ncbi:hypothetical protein [Arcticibacterium luteifluviistationis]|uniref:hypothetical protein n=1 Tax=Arcticibacterium luteifluviistationis TaxID=1784714 RepID=UPI0019550823|nr:hypothetical protein [Arcticibacterium luteifluviistationis]
MKNTDILIDNKALKSVDLFSRIALFTVFFWFGFLKVLGTSPAENLVHKLFDMTLAPIMPIDAFLPVFGAFECFVGLIWLFPKLTRVAFVVTLGHMACTFIPLGLLTSDTWQSSFTLTLTGQYIIKNVVLITLAWYLYAIDSSKKSHKWEEPKSELAEVMS